MNQIYETLKENEMYQRKQKMIHMQLHENNFDLNNVYLQRRQLNIQDEDHIVYNSDEEEQKIIDERGKIYTEEDEEVKEEERKGEEEPQFESMAGGVPSMRPSENIPGGRLLANESSMGSPDKKAKLIKEDKNEEQKDEEASLPYRSLKKLQEQKRRKVPVRRQFLDINGSPEQLDNAGAPVVPPR